jgi:hypothetical protein
MGCTPSRQAVVNAAASHPRDAMLMISSEKDLNSPSTTTLGSDSPACNSTVINESPSDNKENEVKIESPALFSGNDCNKEELQVVNNKENNKNEKEDNEDDRGDAAIPKIATPSSPSPYYSYATAKQGSVVNRNAAFLSLLASSQPSWRS